MVIDFNTGKKKQSVITIKARTDVMIRTYSRFDDNWFNNVRASVQTSFFYGYVNY